MLLQGVEIDSRTGRAGAAILLVILVTLVVVAGDSMDRLESAFYDFLQRSQPIPGSDRVLIVDTSQQEHSDIWDATSFPEIVTALNSAGAALIVPVQSPPANMALPNLDQIAALAELQQRVNAEGGKDKDVATWAAPLESLRRQYQTRAVIESTVREAGNVVLALPIVDPRQSPALDAGACAAHALSQAGSAAEMLKLREALVLPASLCASAVGAGYSEYWPDRDGIVRRTHLVVESGNGVFPSLALAAAQAQRQGQDLSIAADNRLRIGQYQIAAGSAYTSLNRYYRSTDGAPAFKTVAASELLAGDVPETAIRGRFVVVGGTTSSANAAFRTPVAQGVTAAELIATSLSNLVESDFIMRPAWFGWAELGLMIFVAALILIAAPGMTTNGAALAGVFVAVLLLTSEAYLLIGQGVWVEMVTPTLFAVLGIVTLQSVTRLWPAPAAAARKPAAQPPRVAALSNEDELDLAFSVLRQQAPTADTKERLYQIALAHGRRREFAKAERVLAHLVGIDAHYRDAAAKLKKLSGSRAAAESDEPAAADAPPSTPRRKPGTRTLGRYEVERIIGRGAMATVYLGLDPKINRQVAIKTIALAEEFSDADLEAARAQFLREAESAGRLNHPHIITIYDVGEDDDVAYLAMEYFEGKSLAQHAQPNSLLPPKWVLELTARAADALHYAHGQRVVHRDIKPANLLYDSGSDAFKITDFGIARLTDTSRTKTGIILGTPSYMSPEQLAASAVTGQSDLYSLGITMYQLLTGNPPFRADSIPKLMEKIVREKQPPVSSVRDDLPECIDEILDLALAKNPDDRFPNGRAMALALRDCCSTFDG